MPYNDARWLAVGAMPIISCVPLTKWSGLSLNCIGDNFSGQFVDSLLYARTQNQQTLAALSQRVTRFFSHVRKYSQRP